MTSVRCHNADIQGQITCTIHHTLIQLLQETDLSCYVREQSFGSRHIQNVVITVQNSARLQVLPDATKIPSEDPALQHFMACRYCSESWTCTTGLQHTHKTQPHSSVRRYKRGSPSVEHWQRLCSEVTAASCSCGAHTQPAPPALGRGRQR